MVFDGNDGNLLAFEVLGGYPHKDKLKGKEYQEKLYEISDLSAAGLTKRSFIDILLSYEVTFNDLFYAKTLGNLSLEDIVGLINKDNDYISE